MERRVLVERLGTRELAIRDGAEIVFRISERTVYRGETPVWLLVHKGWDLFTGCWELVAARDRSPVAGYSYASSFYRFGEGVRIRLGGSDRECLFRRVSPDDDRWLLSDWEGAPIIESLKPPDSSSGLWSLRVIAADPCEALWPLVCLLAFDRLVCGRF